MVDEDSVVGCVDADIIFEEFLLGVEGVKACVAYFFGGFGGFCDTIFVEFFFCVNFFVEVFIVKVGVVDKFFGFNFIFDIIFLFDWNHNFNFFGT